jgi:uncharacterized protein YbjT (DUF2867 family)
MRGAVVVTGAFSYTGKYAARILLERGYSVRTLTNHPNRPNPFADQVQAFLYNFERPEDLRRSLAGASTLINTYWVRFPHDGATYETAVRNSRLLIEAGRDAEVQRIVQVSIANPSLQSPLGYYKGKAQVEEAVRESGLSYTILRPTVIFGAEDILINNIAWFVRHFPVFAIPGDGQYLVRPIYVEDMARLLADAVEPSRDSVADAVGPETFTFEELVRTIARHAGRADRLVHVPAVVAHISTLLTGWMLRDVVLTREEYKGLMSNLLGSDAPATGQTRLSSWLAEHGNRIGTNYRSELARHFDKN